MSRMISAVLFDLDETLLDRTGSLVAFLADQYLRLSDRLGSATLDSWRERFLLLDGRGHVHKSVVYQSLIEAFGGDQTCIDALLDDYRQRCCEHAQGFPGMAATLSGLRSRGLKLGIVTNGETELQARNINALGLNRLVDKVLISEAEELRKPDAALFLRAADRLHVEPANCLFVGDDPAVDILGARGAGMQTVWFRNRAIWPSHLSQPQGPVIDALTEVLDWPGIQIP